MEGFSDLDKITIEGIDVLGHHGVDEAERKVGHRVIVDVDMWLDLSEAVAADDIQKTVNYEKACALIERVAGQEEFLLLESLASEIGDRLLESFDVEEVAVRVRKASLPIATRVTAVTVEIRKSRGA
jgi:dihydroneopterin aldolase